MSSFYALLIKGQPYSIANLQCAKIPPTFQPKIPTTRESNFRVIMEHAIGCSLSRHIVLFPQINDE